MGTVVGRPCRFLGEGAMKPRNINVVIGGKRYRTETATLLASGPSDKEHLGQTGAEPEPILEVRLGGVELGALLLRGNWEGWGGTLSSSEPPRGTTSFSTSPLRRVSVTSLCRSTKVTL